jgi:DNA-binding NarL/FixJ family response regulator
VPGASSPGQPVRTSPGGGGHHPPPEGWVYAGDVPVRVVVAEDSYIVREGLEQVLAGTDEVELVASCEDLESLQAAIEREKPDVVLTDIRMPPTMSDEGIRLAAELRETHPDVGVIALSQYSDAAYALALLDPGSEGRGYLLKERIGDRAHLVSAIEQVATGGSVVDPKVLEGLIAARSRGERSPLAELTPREREVLAAIAEGRSNSAIAESLVLTKRAVEKHINSIFMKLDLSYAADADDISKRVKAVLIWLAEGDSAEAGSDDGH